MGNGFFNIVYDLKAEHKRHPFRIEILRPGTLHRIGQRSIGGRLRFRRIFLLGQKLNSRLVGPKRYSGRSEVMHDSRQSAGGHSAMNEDRIQGIAYRRTLCLGIMDDG